jgi:hypothetical protein
VWSPDEPRRPWPPAAACRSAQRSFSYGYPYSMSRIPVDDWCDGYDRSIGISSRFVENQQPGTTEPFPSCAISRIQSSAS